MRFTRRIAPALAILVALQVAAHAGGTRATRAPGATRATRRPAKPVVRADKKFARVARFEKKLPAMRKEVSRRLTDPKMDVPTAVAAIVRIMDATNMRVGSARFAERDTKPTHGASSLRKRQVKVQGDVVTFSFLGKTGVGGKRRRWRKTVRDPELADAVRVFLKSPGDRLFSTPRGAVSERQVRTFFAAYGGLPKDLRTHQANELFADETARLGAPTTGKLKQAVENVARKMEHEPSVSLKSYIDPLAVDAYKARIPADSR